MKEYFLFALLSALALAARSQPASTAYRVKVTDVDGRPLAGVALEGFKNADAPATLDHQLQVAARATTGPDGTASLAITNDSAFTLLATKPGLSWAWSMCYPARDLGEDPVELTLTPPAAVSGVVQDATGKPVPGAQVWPSPGYRPSQRNGPMQRFDYLGSSLGRLRLAAHSDAQGRFRIEGLPADATMELAAAKPGLALDTPPRAYIDPRNLGIQAGQSNLLLTLKPAGAIEGQVIQEVSGAPVTQARIAVRTSWFGGEVEPAVSGAEGRFHLADLGPGDYTLHTVIGTNDFPDLVCDEPTVSVEAGVTNRDVKITASRGGVMEVSVRDESKDRPLPDVLVSANRQGPGAAAKTSAAGLARLRLSPGDYSVFVSRQGWIGEPAQATLEAGQTNRLSLTIKPAPKLAATVLDPEGQPAPKVAVSIFPYHQGDKLTDADGHVTLAIDSTRFAGMQSQRVLVARDPARNLAAALEIDDEATNATLRLQPALTFAGKITDAKGQPIPKAEAQLHFWTERMSTTQGAPVRADAAGRFEIKALPPGRRYGVNASAKGFGQETRTLQAEETATRRVELDPFQLPLADQRIAGVVYDPENKPARGAMVQCYGEKQPNASGQTDAQGRFAFDHVCPGTIQISANRMSPASAGGNSYASTTAEAGDTNITLQLGESRAYSSGRMANSRPKIKGIVLDPAGKPAPGVKVNLFPSFWQGDKSTDAEGRFTLVSDENQLGGMQNNERIVVARDLARNLAAAFDLDEDATNATVKLEPALTLVGRVTDPDGKAIPNAQVQPLFQTERMGSSLGAKLRVDAQGRFEVRALPPGRNYSLQVSARGFGTENRRVDSPENDNRRLELDPFALPLANLCIAGVVLDADDKPVSGASLYSYGDKQPNLNARTDSKGHFTMDKVCAGTIQLSANSQRGGFGNVRAEGGDTNIVLRLRSASNMVMSRAPQTTSLKGKPLPDLAPLGLAPTNCPADQPLLAVLIDAEQRPCRRALKLLTDKAASLKEKGVVVLVLQAGALADEAFASWKDDAALPFPVGCFKTNPEQARAAWGASALPWLILTDKSHRVAAEGFSLDDLEAKVEEVRSGK